MATAVINYMLLSVFGSFFITNTYQSLLESYLPFKVGVLVYFFHRMLIGFNFFFMASYALICSKLINYDAFLLISEIFYDIAVLFGYAAFMCLVYQTTLSYQIAFKMKIDKNEAYNVYLLHVIIFCAQFSAFIVKVSLAAVYNTTYYSGFYLITCAFVLLFISFYCWISFFKLSNAIAETSASNHGYKSGPETSTSFQIETFKSFLIYLSIGNLIAFLGQLYNAYTYFTSPVIFFDPGYISGIHILAIISTVLSFIATFYFWKSNDSTVSPEILYQSKGKNASNDGRHLSYRRSSLSNNTGYPIEELELDDPPIHQENIKNPKNSVKYKINDTDAKLDIDNTHPIVKIDSSNILE